VIARATILALLAVSAGAGAAAADPVAAARPVAELPPYEVLTIIRSARFDPLNRPVRRGPNYVVRAIDRIGTEVRVIVDARSGRILSALPTDAVLPPGAPAPAYGPPRLRRPFVAGRYDYPPPYGYPPAADLAPEVDPAPGYPASPRTSAVPPAQHSAALTPPRTPMPRPRPAVTSAEEAPAKDAAVKDAKETAAPEARKDASASASLAPTGAPAARGEHTEKADKPAAPSASNAMPPVAPLE
jgi:hypothetical protein